MDGSASRQRRCFACSEVVARGALRCGSCGERLRSRTPVRPRAEKSPALAAALAAFLPGVGHIYCDRVGAGVLIMIGWPAAVIAAWFGLVVVGLAGGSPAALQSGVWALYLANVGVWVWQMIDAYGSATAPARRFSVRRGSRGRHRRSAA